jgi:hypothetical protein
MRLNLTLKKILELALHHLEYLRIKSDINLSHLIDENLAAVAGIVFFLLIKLYLFCFNLSFLVKLREFYDSKTSIAYIRDGNAHIAKTNVYL